jgi:hypothetical protein
LAKLKSVIGKPEFLLLRLLIVALVTYALGAVLVESIRAQLLFAGSLTFWALGVMLRKSGYCMIAWMIGIVLIYGFFVAAGLQIPWMPA